MLSLCLRLHTGQHFAASNLISLSRPALKRTQMELKLTNSLSKSWGCNLCRYKGPVTGAWGPGPKGPRGAHWTLAWPDRWGGGAIKTRRKTSHRFPTLHVGSGVKNHLRQTSVMSASPTSIQGCRGVCNACHGSSKTFPTMTPTDIV